MYIQTCAPALHTWVTDHAPGRAKREGPRRNVRRGPRSCWWLLFRAAPARARGGYALVKGPSSPAQRRGGGAGRAKGCGEYQKDVICRCQATCASKYTHSLAGGLPPSVKGPKPRCRRRAVCGCVWPANQGNAVLAAGCCAELNVLARSRAPAPARGADAPKFRGWGGAGKGSRQGRAWSGALAHAAAPRPPGRSRVRGRQKS